MRGQTKSSQHGVPTRGTLDKRATLLIDEDSIEGNNKGERGKIDSKVRRTQKQGELGVKRENETYQNMQGG